MSQLGLVDECCEAIHVQLSMQRTLCAYNVSSQLHAWLASKVHLLRVRMQVRLCESAYQIHSGLTACKPGKAFHQLHYSHHSSTEPAV